MKYDEFRKEVKESIAKMPVNHVFILRETFDSNNWFPKVYNKKLNGYFGMRFGKDIANGVITNVARENHKFKGVQAYKKIS